MIDGVAERDTAAHRNAHEHHRLQSQLVEKRLQDRFVVRTGGWRVRIIALAVTWPVGREHPIGLRKRRDRRLPGEGRVVDPAAVQEDDWRPLVSGVQIVKRAILGLEIRRLCGRYAIVCVHADHQSQFDCRRDVFLPGIVDPTPGTVTIRPRTRIP